MFNQVVFSVFVMQGNRLLFPTPPLQAFLCLKSNELKIESFWCMSSLGEPISAIRPLSTTMIVSKFKMFDILCAIDITVWLDFDISDISICSECSSRPELDSSMTSIEERRSSARAMLNSWRWPALKFCPSSAIGSSRKPMLVSMSNCLSTDQISWSVCSSVGSRLSL